MRAWTSTAILLAVLSLASGCGQQVYIENQQFILSLGMDLEDNDQLVVYTSSPVFNREAKQKQTITKVTIHTLREAKRELNAKLNGNVASGKLQNVLIGKRLIQQMNVLPYMDMYFRDPKNEINANLVVIDGSVNDVISMNTKDKGRIGPYIKQMVDSSYNSRLTVQTTLQKFHQQMLDKTMTPFLTEMKAEKDDLVITGTSLLHKDGTYASSLNVQESSLLLLMQRNTKNPIPLTMHLPSEVTHVNEKMSVVSFDISHSKVEIKPRSVGEQLTIDMLINIKIQLTEKLFEFDLDKQGAILEAAIGQELKKECDALIQKVQSTQTDPFHIGLYVKAFDYKNWKRVQDNWGEAFSAATVQISPKVSIHKAGVSE